MSGSVRRVRLSVFTLLFTTAGLAAFGCATGTTTDDASLLPDGPDDASTDTRPTKGRTDAADAETSAEPVGEDEDSGDEGDDGDDAGGIVDAGGKDASVKSDAGKCDAGDAGSSDAAVEAGGGSDAGSDAATDAGADGADENEGGTTVTKPAQGEVVLSEVMYNPLGTEPDAEWIEVYNKASSTRLLSGLVIRDGSNRSHTIASGVTIAPGAYVVLASKRAAVVASGVADAVIGYEYNAGPSTAVQLANGTGGEVVLLDGATEVARSHYGTIGLSSADNGQSIQLRVLDYASAGAKANWCYSPTAWAPGSGKGTPGAASNCP